jgi:uncharacterized repeat protein (TIGR04076 family)
LIILSEQVQLKISVLRRFEPSEVFKELPVTPVGDLPACEYFEDGQEFIIEGNEMPEGFCSAAWKAINPSVKTLLDGGDYHWIEEKGVLVTCCLDGLRPVIFKLERARNLVKFYEEELRTREQLAPYRFGGGEQHLDQDADFGINPISSPDKIGYKTTTKAPERKKKNGDS